MNGLSFRRGWKHGGTGWVSLRVALADEPVARIWGKSSVGCVRPSGENPSGSSAGREQPICRRASIWGRAVQAVGALGA